MRKRKANGDHNWTRFNGDNENDNDWSIDHVMPGRFAHEIERRQKLNGADERAQNDRADQKRHACERGAPAYSRQSVM